MRMRTLLLFGALATWALVPRVASAQTGSVVGQVTDTDTQRPIAGAQVYVQGTTRGTITNQDGRYLLAGIPVGEQTVMVTMIGYGQGSRTITVTSGDAARVDFQLETTAVALDAVVVNAITGQQEQKRAVGSNVGTITAQDLNLKPVLKVADVLTSRTPGVTMQGVSGTLGTAQRIRIRGANSLSLSNDPLIYVDGVQMSTSTGGFGVGGQQPTRLNDLNPDDIESIEVLKGPAASALYGTAAANGVIQITTKRGRSGTASWNAYWEVGRLDDITAYPDNIFTYQLNTPGASLFRSDGRFDFSARSACFDFQAATGACTQDSTMVFNTLKDSRTSPFQTGFTRKWGMNVSGGGDRVTYYLSGELNDGVGVIYFNRQNQKNLRANVSALVAQHLKVNVTMGYMTGYLALNNNDNSIFSPLINGLLGAATYFPPTSTGEANPYNYGWFYRVSDLAVFPTEQAYDRMITGGNMTYTPLPWLSANMNVGLDLIARHDFDTLQPNRLPISTTYALGFRESQRTAIHQYTANGSLTGTFTLMPGLISTSTAGGSYLKQLNQSTYGFGAGPVEGTANLGATSSLFSVDEGFSEVITVGGFVREQLAYHDRLFLGLSLRGDNNSAFGTDYGFIYYPAANLSWLPSEEAWFPKLSWLTSLRLRGAFGTSGLRPDFRDAITYFSPVSVQVDGSDVSGVTLSSTGNTKLKPERTSEYETGFDAGFLGDRLGLEFTYFHKESQDALIQRRLAPSFGLTASVWDNLGSVLNSGTELSVNARVLDTDMLQLDLSFTNTSLKNEILALGEGVEPIILNRGNQRQQQGYPAGAYFQTPYTYDDANGDGLLSASEVSLVPAPCDTCMAERFAGPMLPTYTRTISATVGVGHYVQVSTLFEGRGGNKQLDYTASFRDRTSYSFAAGGRVPTGTFAASDPNAPLSEQAAFIASRYYASNWGYIKDASFVKWRELSLTLFAPPVLTHLVPQLDNASVTLSGRNLATWTNYTGLDPEINESGSSNFVQGEFNTQPPLRYLLVRFNVKF